MEVPYYYSDITYGGIANDEVRETYSKWILGLESERTRRRRIEEGMSQSATVIDLQSGCDLKGKHDCLVQTRIDERSMAVKFRHRQPSDPVRIWTTCVKITDLLEGGINVKHGAIVSGLPNDNSVPPPSSPRVVKELINKTGRNISPRELFTSTLEISDHNASDFIDFNLSDSIRKLPIVIVSPLNNNNYLIDPFHLQESLLGISIVYRLKDMAASLAFTNGLNVRGFSREFGAFGGAVRVYMSGMNAKDNPFSHPLWTPHRLSDIGPNLKASTDSLSRQIGRRVIPRIIPEGHFDLIEDIDRNRHQLLMNERLAALSESEESKAMMETALNDNDKIAREILKLRQVISEKEREHQLYEEETAQKINELKAKSDALEIALQEKNADQENSSMLGVLTLDQLNSIRTVISGENYSLCDVLVSIMALFPDRVVVLETAFRSARESSDFKYCDQAAGLLITLVTKYRDILVSGRPDGEAKAVFGNAKYSSKESDTLGRRGEELRTFQYRGQNEVMLKHLKIGVGEGTATCLRVHFHWDAERNLIVIGHCGRHLDFK
jgi:hypothetical protein